jgi:glycogen debranching enzyme
MSEQTQPLVDEFKAAAEDAYQNTDLRVLNESDTFAILDAHGNINKKGYGIEGIYFRGTRFVSNLATKLEGQYPVMLSSTIREKNDMLSVDMTNQKLTTATTTFHQGLIHIKKNLFINDGGCYIKILLFNYGDEAADFDFSIEARGDFRDIFEIRGSQREKRGELEPSRQEQEFVAWSYHGTDDVRRTCKLRATPRPDTFDYDVLTYHIALGAKETYQLTFAMKFEIEGDLLPETPISYEEALNQLESIFSRQNQLMADVYTANEQFTHWVNRSKTDLLSLLAETKYGLLYPYAGVPWYNTAFGRDGILTAYQTLWVAPEISRQALYYLKQTQSHHLNPAKDAEPGKIFHETRQGEMANTGEIPFDLYYGTIDATPLFIMLAGAYYERTGDLQTCKELWPSIEAALQWIDEYGDLDGDGFVEYQHKAHNGLTNQGWKDSHDAISYENGELAEAPIALCEVQGYVYAAKLKAAKIARALHLDVYEKLEKEAQQLQADFNEKFWDEELQCFILALDAHKNPCRVKSSNAGQCLFTGIATPENATKLAKTLLGSDMFTGWGIRTLSSEAKRYNPMSYHNGSVWPHDVALIAEGLNQYGHHEEAVTLITALFDASLFLYLQRMPELFCGFARRSGEGPTSYPVACSPQAWSVAAVFILLKACLRISIDAPSKQVRFYQPTLPAYLERVLLSNIPTEAGSIALEIIRHDDDIGMIIIEKPEDWSIVIEK